jgi:hypothetical protein
MKTPLKTERLFRVFLPLIMTGVQLGLLAASLIVHHEPWVLSPPPRLPAQSQSDCSGDPCTVTFTPAPEPRFGRLVNVAMLLNLPAVFLGAVLLTVAALAHLPHPHGEPSLLGVSAVFVPVIWYRVGKWLDDQSMFQNQSTQVGVKSTWTMVARAIVWCLFALMLFAFLVERHRESEPTKFVRAVATLWTGAYLAGGLLGDWRRAARHHGPVG